MLLIWCIISLHFLHTNRIFCWSIARGKCLKTFSSTSFDKSCIVDIFSSSWKVAKFNKDTAKILCNKKYCLTAKETFIHSILFYKFVKFAVNKRFWHYKFSVCQEWSSLENEIRKQIVLPRRSRGCKSCLRFSFL